MPSKSSSSAGEIGHRVDHAAIERWLANLMAARTFAPGRGGRHPGRVPREGLLFPYLNRVRSCDRATEFKQRCQGLGISGISLHSYRYAWAERARTCGYPERFAQEALGHNSKAVHRAYAKRATVRIRSPDDFERNAKQGKIVPFTTPVNQAPQPTAATQSGQP